MSDLNNADNPFEYNLEDNTNKIAAYIKEQKPIIIEKLNKSGFGVYFPEKAWRYFAQLIRLKETVSSHSLSPSQPVNKPHCYDLCEKTIKALSNLYNPDKQTITLDDEKTLYSLCVSDQQPFQKRLRDLRASKKLLQSAVPGRNQGEKILFVRNKSSDLATELQDILNNIQEDEINLSYMLKSYIGIRKLCLGSLLSGTSVFDRCFDKKCKSMAKIAIDFWREEPKLVEYLLQAENPYLSKKASKDRSEKRYGYDHILENNFFATIVRNSLPIEQWNPITALAIGCNAFHAGVPAGVLRDFLKKLSPLPDNKYALYMNDLMETITGVFTAIEEENDLAEKQRYNAKNLVSLMTHISHPETLKQAHSFFDSMPESFLQEVVSQPLGDNDCHALVSFLLETPVGQERLPRLKTEDGQNLVWSLYSRSAISAAHMEQIITTAIKQKNTPFLTMPKKAVLSPKLPCYTQLCSYFKNTPEAEQFIDSFLATPRTNHIRFTTMKDFIDDQSLLKEFVLKNDMVPFWASIGDSEKIVSFFYSGDPKKIALLTPNFSESEMMAMLTQPDQNGRTAWHHFCQQKDRLLFGRCFKALYPSFLRVAQQKDNSGRTPLDYMSDSLKFRQVIAEKIPAIEKLITQSGMSLTYEPPVKEKEEKQVPEVSVAPIMAPPHEAPKKREWTVKKIGNDKERKDETYNVLVAEAIEDLPAPQSEALNITNGVMIKKAHFGASTLKIKYKNTDWRIPFVKDDSKGIIYILPGSDRSVTYTNRDYCLIVRSYAKKINRAKKAGRQYE